MYVYQSKATLIWNLTFCCTNTNLMTVHCSSVCQVWRHFRKFPTNVRKYTIFISENIAKFTKSSSVMFLWYIHLQYELKSFCHCISTLNNWNMLRHSVHVAWFWTLSEPSGRYVSFIIHCFYTIYHVTPYSIYERVCRMAQFANSRTSIVVLHIHRKLFILRN